jgi:mevalonate kinase
MKSVWQKYHWRFDYSSEVPMGAGLGSSAVYTTCLAIVLLKSAQIESTHCLSTGSLNSDEFLEAVYELAFKGENYLHGKASGIDHYISLYGGCISFRRRLQPTPNSTPDTSPSNLCTRRLYLTCALNFIILDTKIPRHAQNSIQCVRRLAEMVPNHFPSINFKYIFDRILKNIGKLLPKLKLL